MTAHSPALNMAHVCIFISNSWVFSLSSIQSNFMSHLTPLSQFEECIVTSLHYVWSMPHWVNASKSFVVSFNVQWKPPLQYPSTTSLPSFNLIISNSILWLFSSLQHHLLFHISRRWWENHHGPPSMSLFLSTSTLHPGIRLRNKFKYLEAYMFQW